MKQTKAPAGRKASKRVLILDDHYVTRHGLIQFIEGQPDLMVCAATENAAQAMSAVHSNTPDLILCDLTLPGKSGLEFIKDLRVHHPLIPVLVLSMHEESIYAERVLRAGANGYVMKSEGGDKLLQAIRSVLQGQVFLSSAMTASVLGQFADVNRGKARPDASLRVLTDREFGVFQLIGEGLGTRAIGERLHISGKTVETHRVHIKEKLCCKTSQELIAYAMRWAVSSQIL